jgi:hypothetical protein
MKSPSTLSNNINQNEKGKIGDMKLKSKLGSFSEGFGAV